MHWRVGRGLASLRPRREKGSPAAWAIPAGPSTSLRTLPEARPQSSTGATACAPQRYERDLILRPLAGAGELESPRTWTGEWVKHRMVEAFTIERSIPDKRVGPAIVKGAWAQIDTTDSFATGSIRANWRAKTFGKVGACWRRIAPRSEPHGGSTTWPGTGPGERPRRPKARCYSPGRSVLRTAGR